MSNFLCSSNSLQWVTFARGFSFSIVFKRELVKGVSIKDGAITFTLILNEANSAARLNANPSIAALEVDIDE